jgi:hypothetical protein
MRLAPAIMIAVAVMLIGGAIPVSADYTTPWQSAVATEYDGTPPNNANPGYAGGWQTNWGLVGNTYYPVALRYTKFNDPNPLIFLTAVEWELTGECWGTVGLENKSANTNVITYYLRAAITLYKPGGGQISQVIPLASGTRTKTPWDGLTDFGGTSGESFSAPEAPPIPATASDSGTLTAPLDLFAFTGTGTVDLPLTAAADSRATDTQGNVASDFETHAHGFGRLRYHYDLIPEPGTTSLFLVGLAAMGIARRRRSKTA